MVITIYGYYFAYLVNIMPNTYFSAGYFVVFWFLFFYLDSKLLLLTQVTRN